MAIKRGVKILGTGSFLPEKILTNHDLEKIVETSDEWIRTRSGICERRIADKNTATSDLAVGAANRALQAAEKTADDIDLIVVATLSPDCPFPNTACFVQKKIEATNAACFSLEAACSGFLYAFEVASNMLRGGDYNYALVIGAEKMSSVVDWTDRSTCVLFGDGAGAMVLTATDSEETACVSSQLHSDGRHTDLLCVPGGGSACPSTHETLDQGINYLKMNGREIFKLAVTAMVDAARTALEKANIDPAELRWLVPHQANLRIVSAVGKRLGIEEDRVYINLDKYGNTSAATIPIAMDEIVKQDLVKRGDYVLLVAFGGGLTWGATILRWV